MSDGREGKRGGREDSRHVRGKLRSLGEFAEREKTRCLLECVSEVPVERRCDDLDGRRRQQDQPSSDFKMCSLRCFPCAHLFEPSTPLRESNPHIKVAEYLEQGLDGKLRDASATEREGGRGSARGGKRRAMKIR